MGQSTKEAPSFTQAPPASYCTDLYPAPFLLCICAEKHTALGATFMIFVAIRISWIRAWFIRTPCGREEVSSQGQCGVNYILSTPPLLKKRRRNGLDMNIQFLLTKKKVTCLPFNVPTITERFSFMWKHACTQMLWFRSLQEPGEQLQQVTHEKPQSDFFGSASKFSQTATKSQPWQAIAFIPSHLTGCILLREPVHIKKHARSLTNMGLYNKA